MKTRIGIFWPADYRPAPNQWALPHIAAATAQMERALKRLGRPTYRIKGYLTKPHEAIEKLGPVDDPLVGIFVHWVYGPHTTDGVVGKESPLLLASNFSGIWPGLVGLLNTSACLEAAGRKHSRIWTESRDWKRDAVFMARLEEWCTTGRIRYPEDELAYTAPISAPAAKTAAKVAAAIRRRRVLAMMLGDTSMGMTNGYFGPRLLAPIGFAEHKVDQAWLLARGPKISAARIERAFAFVQAKGVKFHWRENGAEDFTEDSTREQLRDYLAVLDLLKEFKCDCLGWQYQLGLLPLRPPSDFSEGLLNSACRPESDGQPIVCSTEADQGNLVPMELMKRVLLAKRLPASAIFHDVRWGGEHQGRFLWVLLNSGSTGAYPFNHDTKSLRGVHSYRQSKGYFPIAGGTFAGESLPGKLTWARAYLRDGALWMDLGRGESVKMPPAKREAWWRGTTRQWPFMAADLGVGRDTIMAHFMANHIAVCYGDIFEELLALSQQLGFKVRVMGKV